MKHERQWNGDNENSHNTCDRAVSMSTEAVIKVETNGMDTVNGIVNYNQTKNRSTKSNKSKKSGKSATKCDKSCKKSKSGKKQRKKKNKDKDSKISSILQDTYQFPDEWLTKEREKLIVKCCSIYILFFYI